MVFIYHFQLFTGRHWAFHLYHIIKEEPLGGLFKATMFFASSQALQFHP